MSVLKQLPFVKLLLPFIAGISSVILQTDLGAYTLIPLTVFVSAFVFLNLKSKSLLSNRMANACVYLIFFAFGGWLTHVTNPRNHEYNLEKTGLDGIFKIRIVEIPEVKVKTTKIQARVIYKIQENSKMVPANELALFYFDKIIEVPKPGDELLVKCSFKPIPEPENPYQFNYKRFLKWQGIYYQTFIRNPNNIKNTGINNATFFQKLSYSGTRYLKNLFQENIHDSTALGVTEALIFGYKEDLPKDLVESYSRTGTLHVLAVSGLHVAIVFLMLAKFLWFLDKWRRGVWLKTAIVIICIWGYCILTGMSPSIIRAGVMISLVLLGKALNRQAHIFNTVAVSAFLILLINPFWLINVGFQLSFAAVIGIVYLQQYLLPLWTPPNKFLNAVWNILIISMCAQIATFPLSLYYFNQFPNYFLLSNLIIIPLTSLVIYTGIGMVVVSKIPLLLFLFSWLTENLVKLTNHMVVTIENLPLSFIDGIKLNLFQLILLYICIGNLIYCFNKTEKKGFAFFLIGLSLLVGISSYDNWKLKKENHMIIFNIPNQNAILLSDGRRSVLISDNCTLGKQLFYIRGWLIHNRVWPIYKMYDLDTIQKLKVALPEMDLVLNNGVLFFKGKILNLSSKNLGKLKDKKHYIVPKLFQWTTFLDDNIYDTLYIGHEKSKRLQKKVKIFLSKYHNCVINEVQYMSLIN